MGVVACRYCDEIINLDFDNVLRRWVPLNLDGSQHRPGCPGRGHGRSGPDGPTVTDEDKEWIKWSQVDRKVDTLTTQLAEAMTMLKEIRSAVCLDE